MYNDSKRGVLRALLVLPPSRQVFPGIDVAIDSKILNSLISSGEIPGLFKPEEMENLFNQANVDIERDVN